MMMIRMSRVKILPKHSLGCPGTILHYIHKMWISTALQHYRSKDNELWREKHDLGIIWGWFLGGILACHFPLLRKLECWVRDSISKQVIPKRIQWKMAVSSVRVSIVAIKPYNQKGNWGKVLEGDVYSAWPPRTKIITKKPYYLNHCLTH